MVKLDILQRIIALSVLPKEGNLIEIKIIKNLKEKIGFNEDEVNRFKLKAEGEKYTWDLREDKGAEFEITEGEAKLITKGLKELDNQNKLTEQHLTLCELFLCTPGN
jgi:hypothetical protein